METVWDSSTIIFFGMDEGKSEYSYLTLHPTVAKVYEEFMSSLDSKALNLNAGGEEEKKEKKKTITYNDVYTSNKVQFRSTKL